MLRITPDISIDDAELRLSFIRSAGPGGQNVNKVATAAQLQFDVRNSLSLAQEVKDRLVALAGRRVSGDGVITITARKHRSQNMNRDDAFDRLADLIRQAAVRPKRRRATRPTAGSRQRRLASKKHHSETKSHRRDVGQE